MFRWRKHGNISDAYLRLFELDHIRIKRVSTPRYINHILSVLKNYHNLTGSWDKIANDLGIHKRTLLRWKKTRKIRRYYCKLVEKILRERYSEFYSHFFQKTRKGKDLEIAKDDFSHFTY